jgi:hypothetical protein
VGFLFGLHFDGSTRRLQAQLVDLVERDPLTGVANRRELDLGLSRSLSSAARLDQRVTEMILDVDFFKRFNDHRGHEREICLCSALRRPSRGIAGTGRTRWPASGGRSSWWCWETPTRMRPGWWPTSSGMPSGRWISASIHRWTSP